MKRDENRFLLEYGCITAVLADLWRFWIFGGVQFSVIGEEDSVVDFD